MVASEVKLKENLLSIDCGTQSMRALLFNPQGDLLAKSKVPIESYFSEKPGWVELDPENFWTAMCRACGELFNQPAGSKESIAAVALTTQRASVVNLDKNGKPLRPAIIWLDQRRATDFPKVGSLWRLVFRLAGAMPTVRYLQAECEANWIAQHQPEIWEKTYRYTYLSGFLTHRLTGEFKDSVGCQVGYMPFDYKRQAWAAKNHWYWQALVITPDKLVELVPVGSPIGEISAEASRQSGIPAGLPLIAAAGDKACEVLGAGSLKPNVACLSYGTTATINTTHEKYYEIVPLIPPYPAAVPGLYNLELQIYRGYWMVSWFKQEFGMKESTLAEIEGVEAESLLDELVRSVPAGSDGLVLQPYWSPALVHPGPEARGAIIGFRDIHTRAHLYRAILEGLAFALLEGKERTEKRTGVKIDQLRIVGGGSQSDAAMQLTADVFGMPAARPHTYEASGLGAAIVAAVGAGIHSGYEDALAAMTRLGTTFTPHAATHALYRDLYENVYRKMYKRLQPLYMSMQANEQLNG